MPVTLKDFLNLRPAEARLVNWIRAGDREGCVISPGVPPEDAPEDVRLRASFVRYLALGGCDACRPSEKGLLVAGAYIEGDGREWAETRGLDLEGCRLPGDLVLLACRFPDLLLLRGAEGRNFNLSGSHLMVGTSASRLEAKGSVFLRDVTATGTVRLLGARLGGSLEADGATFTAVGEDDAFSADRLEVGGSVFLRGMQAEGLVSFPSARIERSLQTDDETRLLGTLNLRAARIGEIVDHPDGWPKTIALDRCSYGAFVRTSPTNAETRIRWLSLQDGAYPPGTFHPQPWEECARALREGGHSGAARTILIEKERRQRKAKRTRVWQALEAARTERDAAPRAMGFAPGNDRVVTLWWQLLFHRVWDAILGAVVGYGRKPQNAAIWLGVFWLVGAVIFGHAGGHGAIKPSDPKIQIEAIWKDCHDSAGHRTQYDCFMEKAEVTAYPRFNALIYSADTLLPVISFEMQSYWLPDDRTIRGTWVRRYLWVHIVMGWALTLLAVAGFSGLVKSDSR